MLPPEVAKLPYNKRKQLLALLEAKEDKRRHNKIASLYPNKGELRRELYVKHLEFFESGADYIERLLMAGNRTGKTVAGAYETTLHLTGNYPDWWEGKRFDRPTRFWAAGKTSETTRDIVQTEMLGQISDLGSGMIPRDAIVSKSPKAGGVPGAIDTVLIRYKYSDECSTLGFKCYTQGRGSFEGTAQDGVWFDEEAPFDVYNEAMMRIATTKGIIYTTFTPLEGLSDMVMSFLPQEYSFKDMV